MTTVTFGSAGTLDQGPALVSELPTTGGLRPTLLARLRGELAARRRLRDFERALSAAGYNERGDLHAMARRG
jgi:hypothetical protein